MQHVCRVDACAVVGVAVPAGDLGQENHGFRRFPLAEECRFIAFRRLGGPELEEFAGNRSDA
jgi:hypothetical protein